MKLGPAARGFFHISILKGKPPAYVKAIADGVNSAVIETMGFPADDRYQIRATTLTGEIVASVVRVGLVPTG